MKDKIIIKDLEVFANHGFFAEEKTLGQKFIVCAELYTDFIKAAEKDDITLSVDYGYVCKKIYDYMRENTYNLIETAAQKTAEMLLDEFSGLSGIKLEIKKPWAPIGLSLEYTSVCIHRQWHDAYIAFGSNMGDKKSYIDTAVEKLRELKGCRLEKVSDYIVTKPYGSVGQDDFLNGVLLLKTYLDPYTLLERLHDIENQADRKRTIRWGPRTLDLDILLYDNEVIDTAELVVPHYDMHNRKFVLQPLDQIAPYVRHPLLKKTAAQLLREL